MGRMSESIQDARFCPHNTDGMCEGHHNSPSVSLIADLILLCKSRCLLEDFLRLQSRDVGLEFAFQSSYFPYAILQPLSTRKFTFFHKSESIALVSDLNS